METKVITIYECSFCSKYYKRKHFCERHEMQCSNNPNNMHDCYDCTHLEVYREPAPDNETSRKVFDCRKQDIRMHTCKAESRGFAESLKTQRMPIDCKFKQWPSQF